MWQLMVQSRCLQLIMHPGHWPRKYPFECVWLVTRESEVRSPPGPSQANVSNRPLVQMGRRYSFYMVCLGLCWLVDVCWHNQKSCNDLKGNYTCVHSSLIKQKCKKKRVKRAYEMPPAGQDVWWNTVTMLSFTVRREAAANHVPIAPPKLALVPIKNDVPYLLMRNWAALFI